MTSNLDLDFFEKVILYKSITDERYLAAIIDYIQPRYFTNPNFQKTFSIITSFFGSRSAIPTTTEILSLCNTPELKENFKKSLGLIKDIDKNLNEDELYANTERYLKEKSVYYTMTDVADKCSKGIINASDILAKFERCCSINLAVDTGFSLFKDTERLITDLQVDEPTISSGWDWLDSKLNGGFLKNGRALYIFAGETNIGKSIVLGNIACNMVKNGKNVLLVTLEMSEMMYARRIAGSLTGIAVNSLRHEIPTLRQRLNGINTNGQLLIKEFPPSTITVAQLKSFITKIKQSNHGIDAIVVDYVNLLHSTVGGDSYERVKYATEQLRALSYVFNCPIISATQLNRTGYGIQDPKLNTIGESLGLGMTADAIFSVYQLEDDKELDIIRLGSMKNRFGSNYGTCELNIDYTTLTISNSTSSDIKTVTGNVLNSIEDLAN